MNRRRFLAGATVLPVAVAGCLGRGENPDTPNQMAVESRHWTGIVFEDTKQVAKRLELEDKPIAYHEIITDREAAEDRIEREDGGEFIEEPDFDESYLVVIAAGYWSSSDEFELAEIDRTESGLHVGVRVESPDDEQLDDLAPHSLAVRVTDEQAVVPDEISIEIDGTKAGVD